MADLELAKKRFKLCQDTDAQQRTEEVSDLEFQVPEKQWDEAAREERMGRVNANVPVPARPMLTIDKLRQPRQLILNQAKAANLGVKVHPVSEDADKDTAEMLQDLYRRIERDSNAQQARLWALDRAVQAGRGFYRVSVKFDEDSDPQYWDQEIRIERILYQQNVYFDPAAQMADYSDADFCFVAQYLSLEQFKVLYPKAKLAEADANDSQFWESQEQQAPNWFKRESNGTKSILVCEYWYKTHETEEIAHPVTGQVRVLDQVKVSACHITGDEILREQEWGGRYIPIIFVPGTELQVFDERRRFFGMIRTAKDAQRAYNYAASSFIERMALEPKAPWVMEEGQVEGYESMWQQSNTRNFPVLVYKGTSIGDKPTPPPQRAQVSSEGTALAAQGAQMFDEFIQTTTAIYDPSLGRDNPRDKSGKAILALQQQSDAGTSQFLGALADVSMNYEARVVLDLIPVIYDRPGRITTILHGEEGKVEPVMLNAPYVEGPQGPQPATQMDVAMRKPIKQYTLKRGGYGVAIEIGKSFQTRLQQGADEIGQILSADPSLMPMIGDVYFRFRDFPGAKQIADRLVKIREKQFPGLGDEEKPDASQLQAQVQAMGEQMQGLEQQLQEAVKMLETEAVKQQAESARAAEANAVKERIAQATNESRERIAMAGNETKLVVADADSEKDQVENAFDRQHETDRDHEEMAHEAALAAMNARSGKELAAQNTELREPPGGRSRDE